MIMTNAQKSAVIHATVRASGGSGGFVYSYNNTAATAAAGGKRRPLARSRGLPEADLEVDAMGGGQRLRHLYLKRRQRCVGQCRSQRNRHG